MERLDDDDKMERLDDDDIYASEEDENELKEENQFGKRIQIHPDDDDDVEMENKCPYSWIQQQLFTYERCQRIDESTWQFHSCVLNQQTDPFLSGTKIDQISIDFNEGIMTLHTHDSEDSYTHQLIFSSHLLDIDSIMD